MVELIPILLEFVRSRQKPGGYVVLVAHNGRGSDVPFLVHEFRRNDFEIPSNWYFLDTIPLSAQVMKSAGIFLFIFFPSPGCNLDILSLDCLFFRYKKRERIANASRILWNQVSRLSAQSHVGRAFFIPGASETHI